MKIFYYVQYFSKNTKICNITTRFQNKRHQEKAKNLNQDKNQEKLDEHFSSKPFVKKPGSRPNKIYLQI